MLEGPDVAAALLIATPNQGSEWARLRVWLELRDHLAGDEQRRFSLFAALRDGTGAAKIDLRPGSRFLTELKQPPLAIHGPNTADRRAAGAPHPGDAGRDG